MELSLNASLLASALLAVSACAIDPEPASTSTETSALTFYDKNGDPCPKLGCGSNSPYLGAEFHELDWTGAQANAEGFRLLSLEKLNPPNMVPDTYRPIVTGGVLSGVSTTPNVPDLHGVALTDAYFVVTNDNTRESFHILITHVSNSQLFWRAPTQSLETYELKWRPALSGATVPRPLCTNPPNDKMDPDVAQIVSPLEAILFTGDRYDRTTLRVSATRPRASGTWFNIACSGNVMSKLFLNRHTAASETAAFPTTLEMRQAMLKMYTSDVCGTGDAFTVQGTPLLWVNTAGWTSSVSYSHPEAMWNSQGAVCLTTHRLHSGANDMTDAYTPVCKKAQHALPPCPVAFDAAAMVGMGAYLRTYSPAPL